MKQGKRTSLKDSISPAKLIVAFLILLFIILGGWEVACKLSNWFTSAQSELSGQSSAENSGDPGIAGGHTNSTPNIGGGVSTPPIPTNGPAGATP